jgi:hypothetical protein
MNHVEFNTIIAVDPGLKGGIACWKEGQEITAFAMPPTEGDLLELVRTLIAPGQTVGVVEKVGGFTGKPQPGSAMFSFGRNFGFIIGIFQALTVRIDLVTPQKWQKPLSLGTASACASRTQWKHKLKSCAQRLYPALRPTLATSDSILILDFALKSLRIGTPRS